jgi:hypothetical protein
VFKLGFISALVEVGNRFLIRECTAVSFFKELLGNSCMERPIGRSVFSDNRPLDRRDDLKSLNLILCEVVSLAVITVFSDTDQ